MRNSYRDSTNYRNHVTNITKTTSTSTYSSRTSYIATSYSNQSAKRNLHNLLHNFLTILQKNNEALQHLHHSNPNLFICTPISADYNILVFLNVPFLRIWVWTSQQIFCNTCSSVLGWLPHLNSFQFLHILYTVAISTSLHLLAYRDFFFHFYFPSFTSSSQSSGGSRTLHLFIPSHQILAQKLHLKNKFLFFQYHFYRKHRWVLLYIPI